MGWMPPAARDQACDVSPDGHLDVALMVTLIPRSPLAEGARVVISGRSQQRLHAAGQELGWPDRLAAVPADITDRAQLTRLFDATGKLAHLVVTAADLPYGAAITLTEDSVLRALRSKILGPLFAAQLAAPLHDGAGKHHLHLRHRRLPARPRRDAGRHGQRRPGVHSSGPSPRTRPAPRQCGVPGWVDTPVWDQIASPEVKQARLAGMAAQLPGGRIGHPEDIANAVSYLMSDNLVTGTVLHAEGAQLLV